MAAMISPEGTVVTVDEATAERLAGDGWKPYGSETPKPARAPRAKS